MYFLLHENGELEEVKKEQYGAYDSFLQADEIHGCISTKRGNTMYCTVQVPVQESVAENKGRQVVPLLGQGHTFFKFAFLITETQILFADYDGLLTKLFAEMQEESGTDSPAQFLYRMFSKLVENDVRVLDSVYKQLASLEAEIPKDNARFFLRKMYTMKHSIYQLFRYYHQLTEMADDFMEWDGALLPEEETQCFEKFVLRTKRLADDMEIMREYAMEIWEIYQSQINIRQNDIMKVLTIVTTIFLPLSLLAGWYGMNFEYMPEISWKYGYVMAIVISILIIILCLIIFRKKRYW